VVAPGGEFKIVTWLTQRNVFHKRVTQVAIVGEARRRGVTAPSPEAEFDAFFRVHVSRLIGQAFVFTGDLAQAQDLAHEALARAWERWSEVRLLDDTPAWTRKVLYNLAVSEWRRAKVRSGDGITPAPMEGPDVEAMALAEALRALPEGQRHAIVLHDAAGVTVPEIARELNVPEGTIRSWLSRGRASLASQLRTDDEGATHA
jgi:RNA polymerase sigma-70 factor (ECF subfamily)